MFYPLEAIKNQVIYKAAAVFMFDEYLKDDSQKEHFLIFILDTYLLPNGHIIVNWQSIRRRNSTWKVRGYYIDFERWIHVEIMTWIRRGYFDMYSTFKIDEILMSSPRGFFYVVSMSNRRNFCACCFHSIIFCFGNLF